MIFWRIVDNKVHPIEETDTLGFEKADGLAIPDDYLDRKEFMEYVSLKSTSYLSYGSCK